MLFCCIPTVFVGMEREELDALAQVRNYLDRMRLIQSYWEKAIWPIPEIPENAIYDTSSERTVIAYDNKIREFVKDEKGNISRYYFIGHSARDKVYEKPVTALMIYSRDWNSDNDYCNGTLVGRENFLQTIDVCSTNVSCTPYVENIATMKISGIPIRISMPDESYSVSIECNNGNRYIYELKEGKLLESDE